MNSGTLRRGIVVGVLMLIVALEAILLMFPWLLGC